MTHLMVEMVAFLVFSLSTWYFFYRVVPKLGQRATLCLLHNRRDQLYDLAEESPVAERSLVYQDMLFSLTLLIHLVRDKPRRTTLPILASILGIRPWSESAVEDEYDWRSRRYDYEREVLFSSETGEAEFRRAFKVFREKDLVLSLYVATSHPIFFIFILCVSVLSILVAPAIYYYRLCNVTDVKSVGRTLDSIRVYQKDNAADHSYA